MSTDPLESELLEVTTRKPKGSVPISEQLAALAEQFKVVPLCEELVRHKRVNVALGCEVIHHPLVVATFHTEVMNGNCNKMLAMKKERVAKAVTECDWSTVVFMHERPYRAWAVREYGIIEKESDPKKLWEVLRYVWTDSENVFEEKSWWMSVLRKEDARHISDEEGARALDSLSYPVTLYRGHNYLNRYGLSWTLNRNKAAWFANRYSKGGEVAEITVGRHDIVGAVFTRGEEEVILQPKTLRRLMRIGG